MPDQHPQSHAPTRTLKRRQGKRMSPTERQVAQAKFLDSFKLNANITASCQKAGVDRSTFYQWCEHDAEFTVLYHQAEEAAVDMLLAAAWTRAVSGVEKHIVSMGKQVFVDGKPLVEREYSDSVLLRLMSWKIPGFREKDTMVVNNILPKEYVNVPEDGSEP